MKYIVALLTCSLLSFTLNGNYTESFNERVSHNTTGPGKIDDFGGNFQSQPAGSLPRCREHTPRVGEAARRKVPPKGRFYKGQEYCDWLEPWGIDGELAYTKREIVQVQKPKLSIGRSACISMIRFFQLYISPIDGPRSSFYPTSSQYALEAIRKYGVFTGIALGCDRLLRENNEMWVYDVTDKYGMDRKLDPVR